MAERCAQAGVINMGNAMNMNRMVCLLYKGYLKEILDYGLEPDEIEGKVQEFKRDVEVIVGIYASDTLGLSLIHICFRYTLLQSAKN